MRFIVTSLNDANREPIMRIPSHIVVEVQSFVEYRIPRPRPFGPGYEIVPATTWDLFIKLHPSGEKIIYTWNSKSAYKCTWRLK